METFNLKEKRTFILTQNCECGGEFVYCTDNACTDLFGSFFAKQEPNKPYEYDHKCNKCGTTKKFKHIYPMEKDFMIGLSTPLTEIANFVAEAFNEECKDGM